MQLCRQKKKKKDKQKKEFQKGEELSDSLGPLTVTLSAPLPAPLVKTLKSATSFTLTPLGWRPLPVALHAFGFIAERNNRKCDREKYFAMQTAGELPAADVSGKGIKISISNGIP